MEQLNGNEPFTLHGSDTSIMLQDFWRWAYSDLLNNTHRGVLAEFLVHSALETKDVTRADWSPDRGQVVCLSAGVDSGRCVLAD